MWCKGCAVTIAVALIVALLAGWVGVRNLGAFLDVSEDVTTGSAVDAIVVMGGEGGRYVRTQHALNLYEAGVAPVVVFSGGTLLSAGIACSSTEMSMDAAAQLGLPEDAIVISGEAQSTWDEANNLAALADEYGWQSLALVTDRFHTRRSLRTLETTMPQLQIVASAPSDSQYIASRWWANEHSLVFVVNELLKLGYYWKAYGVQPIG